MNEVYHLETNLSGPLYYWCVMRQMKPVDNQELTICDFHKWNFLTYHEIYKQKKAYLLNTVKT